MFLKSPPLKKYDLTSPRFQRDPNVTWREMMDDGPLVRSKMMIMGRCWLATRWQVVNEVLRDQDRFARDAKNAGKKKIPGLLWWVPKRLKALSTNMLAYDHTDHRRLRSLVEQAFLRRNVDGMHDQIVQITDQLLDDCQQIAQQDGTVDLVEHFSRQLPLAVICELLGLPQSDRPKFTEWVRGMTEIRSAFSILKVFPGIRKLLNYFEEQFEVVRQNPRPGLMSELVLAEHEGQQLNKQELLSMVFLLLFAGHETTVHLINAGIWAFEKHPDQKLIMTRDWSKSETVVDEVLRYMSPVQMTKPRFAVEDMELCGQPIQRGESIIGILACANQDPEKFENPEVFDVTRSPNPHLSFGSGPHFCLGFKLAKSECRIAYQRLYERFPDVRMAVSVDEVEWNRRIGLRSIKRLPLILT